MFYALQKVKYINLLQQRNSCYLILQTLSPGHILPSRLLKNFDISSDIQVIPFELNLRRKKWMFMCIYRPPSQNKQYFLDKLSEIINQYSSIYDNYIILGDFNMEPSYSY